MVMVGKFMSRMLKKFLPGVLQRRKMKIMFPSCLQNQTLERQPLFFFALSRVPHAVFQRTTGVGLFCLSGFLLALVLVSSVTCWGAGMRVAPLTENVEPGETLAVDIWAEGIPMEGLSSVQFRLSIDADDVDVSGVGDLSQAQADDISVSAPLLVSEPTSQRSGLGSMFLNGQGGQGVLVIDNESFTNSSALFTYSHTMGALLSSGNGTVARFQIKIGEDVDIDSFDLRVSDVLLMKDGLEYPVEYTSGATVMLRCAATVPDLTGLSFDEAASLLNEKGLSVGTVYEIDNAQGVLALDVVLQQSVNPGKELECGQSVNLAINTAPVEATDITAIDMAGDDSGKVVLSWLPSLSDDVAGYRVYKDSDQISDISDPQSHGAEIGNMENGVEQQLRVCVYDASGNESKGTSLTVVAVDDVSPVVEISGVQEGHYYNHAVTPEITIIENNPSGSSILLNGVPYEPSLLEDDGEYVLTVVANDRAGNEDSRTVAFIIDRTPPTISFTQPLDGDFYAEDVVPEVAINDAYLDPGQTVYLLNGQPYQVGAPVTDEGNYLLSLKVKDLAGNISEETIRFAIDKTAPECVVSIEQPCFETEQGGWISSLSSLSLTATDPGGDPESVAAIEYALDGGSWLNYTGPFTLDDVDDGEHRLACRAIDKAGNRGEPHEKVLMVDNSGPKTDVVFFSQYFEDGDQKLVTKNTEIELVAEDELSGVDNTYYRFDEESSCFSYTDSIKLSDLEYGDHTLCFYSMDNLGNSEIEKTIDFVVVGVDVTSSFSDVPRVLVWTTIPDGHGWFNRDPAYSVEDVQLLLNESFNIPEAFYKIVTELDDFENELAGNKYNITMILSLDKHPPTRVYREIKEAVENGMGLLVSGWNNSLSPLIEGALGVKGLGGLSLINTDPEKQVYFYPGTVFSQQNLRVKGDFQRVKIDGGILAGVIESDTLCAGLKKVTLGYSSQFSLGDEVVVKLFTQADGQMNLLEEERYSVESFWKIPFFWVSGNPLGDVSIDKVSEDQLKFSLDAPYGCLDSGYYVSVEIIHANGETTATEQVYIPTSCEDHLQEGIVLDPFTVMDVNAIGFNEEPPAVVLNQFGEGRTVFFSYDYIDSAFSDDRSKHTEMLRNVAGYLLPEFSHSPSHSTLLFENRIKVHGATLSLVGVDHMLEGLSVAPMFDLGNSSLQYRLQLGDNEEGVYRYFVEVDRTASEWKKETELSLQLGTETAFFDRYLFEPDLGLSQE